MNNHTELLFYIECLIDYIYYRYKLKKSSNKRRRSQAPSKYINDLLALKKLRLSKLEVNNLSSIKDDILHDNFKLKRALYILSAPADESKSPTPCPGTTRTGF